MSTYARFAAATGEFGTPGIAPAPHYPAWQQWLTDLFQRTGRVGAQVTPGGGAVPRVPESTPVPGSRQPFTPGTVTGQALDTVGWVRDLEAWVQRQGRVVGIYSLFVLLGLVGLVFLLLAARGR